jgi:3-deoxy-manno-octulosonate cytidylyltransferase (CMP-KDO synthetase)
VRTLIVIPARWQSTRFPGKPLHPIAGVSMLARTAGVAQRAGKASGAQVVIATDDQRIADHARTIGVASVMTDPALPSGTDRARAAMEAVAPDADFVVNLQGDAPFTPHGHVSALIENAGMGDVVTPVVQLSWERLDALRERKKVTPFSGTTCIRREDGRAIWFSKNILPALRSETKLRKEGELSPVFQHVGLYGYSARALQLIGTMRPSRYEELEGLEQLRFLENGLSVFAAVVQPAAMPMSGIDTPEDAAYAEEMLRKHGDPHVPQNPT